MATQNDVDVDLPALDPVDDADGVALSDLARDTHIGAKVGRGLRWSLVGILVTKMASFLIGLILARLLTQEDFGVFAIAMAVTAFLIHVNDAGVIAAVVQWRGRIEDMTTTAGVMALSFSVLMYGVVFAVAPTVADAASTPDATGVIRVLAAVILIDGITAVRSGMLMRRFRQDQLTLANLFGFIVQAPLSIALAVGGAGAFSFAIAQVVGAAVTGVFVWMYAGVPPAVGFDREVARKLLHFGIPLATSLGIEAILVNADYVIVGRLLGAVELGFYLLAFNVSSWVPGVVTTGVRYVSVAGFSRLAEGEDEHGSLTRGLRRSAPPLITLILPITILIAILAPQLVHVLYGSKWDPAAPALRFLMILMACRVLVSFAFDILTSAGATRSTLWLNLGWAIILIPALYFGTNHDGIRGTAISHAIVGTLVALPAAIFLLERVRVRVREVLPDLVRPAIAGILSAAVCIAGVLACRGSQPLQLMVAGFAGFATYVLVVAPPQLRSSLMSRLRPPDRRSRHVPRHRQMPNAE